MQQNLPKNVIQNGKTRLICKYRYDETDIVKNNENFKKLMTNW